MCIHNDTIVVGAYGDSTSGSNTGAVYIFRKILVLEADISADRSNFTRGLIYSWVEVQKLAPGKGFFISHCIFIHSSI